MKADAVFDSGGIKGIGIIGALSYMESKGFEWQRTAGSSVGALIAAFVAAGYNSKDLKNIVTNINLINFLDKEGVQKIPLVGKALGFFVDKGIYSGEYIESWIDDMLKVKGIKTFKDLYKNGECRLKIIAGDITRKKMITFPDDLYLYGLSPSTFKVSRAIRMSISIPFYFKPVEFIHGNGLSYVVDGSVCCSYPISIFDSKADPKWPTIGFKFDNPNVTNTKLGKTDPLSFLFDIADTMNYKNENSWINDENLSRSILIPTDGISSTDFDISKNKIIKLFKSGYKSAMKFNQSWDFQDYLQKYRHKNKDII